MSADKVSAINNGANPFAFSSGVGGNLAFYAPVNGNKSPEDNYAGQTTDGDLTGTTKFAGNPPVDLLENYL